MRFRPPIQNSSRYFTRLKWVYRSQILTSTEYHIASQHSHFWVQLSAGSAFPQPDKNRKFLRFLHDHHQRVRYHSLCRVGTHSSTHQYKLLVNFLLTRLQEALYEHLTVLRIKFEVYHHFSAEVNFWRPLKTVVPCE